MSAKAKTRSAMLFALCAGSLVLAGCKTFSPDGGLSLAADIAHSELRKDVVLIRNAEDAEAIQARVKALLQKPLTADSAVQIALLNNRGLQAAYNALGLAEASMVEASLPPNPSISISRLTSSVEIEIERKIVANILALATLPIRSEIAADRFHQAQLRAAEETLRFAADARRAFYRAVTARELTGFLTQSKSAAEAATQLARRLGETGAMNKLDQAREQVFYAEITADLAFAQQKAASERERLIQVLGLWGPDLNFKLPGRLPPLPRVKTLPAIEMEAVRRRVDLQIARLEVEALAKSYGLTNATRFINLLEAAGISKTTKEKERVEEGELKPASNVRASGFEIEFQIPIFDFGEVRVRQAEQTYMQAVNRLIEKAVNVRSEARDAYRTYRSAYDLASHYGREVLPLRKVISDEMLLRYNAMQIDVFALLAEARQRIAASSNAVNAQRDFWIAATNLTTAVVGGAGAPGGGEDMRPVAAAGGSEPAGH